MEFTDSHSDKIVTTDALKNKFQKLKKEYQDWDAASSATGNFQQGEPPKNWDSMVCYFRGRDGLGGKSLGKSGDDSTDEDLDVVEVSAEPSSASSKNANTSRKKAKSDVLSVLGELTNCLKEGMNAAKNESDAGEVSSIRKLKKSLKQTNDKLLNIQESTKSIIDEKLAVMENSIKSIIDAKMGSILDAIQGLHQQ